MCEKGHAKSEHSKSKFSLSSCGTFSVIASTDKLSFGEQLLNYILTGIGLLGPGNEDRFTSARRTISMSMLVLMSVLAFLYELTANLNFLTEAHPHGVRIVDIVYSVKYIVKTFTTLVVLIVFWQRSGKLANLKIELNEKHVMNEQNKGNRKRNRDENFIALITILTFVLYLSATLFTRVYNVLHQNDQAVANFPWIELTLLQEEMIIFVLRNITEGIRVLCSGCLGIFLVQFSSGLATACYTMLKCAQRKRENLVSGELTKIWASRENALAMAGSIQRELGALISVIFITDISSMVCVVGETLRLGSPMGRIRLGVSTTIYLVSFFSLSHGLVRLTDVDEKTLNIVKKIQSARIQDEITRREDRSERCASKAPTAWEAWRSTTTAMDWITFSPAFYFSCFGSRKATLAVSGFGYVSRGTILSVFGLLVTFFCFLLEQGSLSGKNPLATTCGNGTA
ncbi:hypothetical protein BV898_06304 [Hypsibius exemplaris]|uniref:Gustatory receptor n=1 Tax=Hypsibius exemplaris TaxID=2072580 RepID=A0A1W0WX44_HYPEX|nr:hypothetical protein BV898_06304 [Hypsibius exemplaris]